MTGVTSDGDGSEPVTFGRFAELLGKSRPYVSGLKAKGVIHGAAFSPDGRIYPAIARQQMAQAADPARAAPARTLLSPGEGTYAAARERKTRAEAERAEIELQVRKGELVSRGRVSEVLMPVLREMRDAVLDVPRDALVDPVLESEVRAALTRALDEFATRIARTAAEMTDGGAAPAA